MNIEKIQEHYDHAREKHPYFCDALIASKLPCSLYNMESDRKLLKEYLRDIRGNNRCDSFDGNVLWSNLLEEEKFEILVALSDGDTAAAIEECYDAIAVLLRVVDVLEGRQSLGKPREEGAK